MSGEQLASGGVRIPVHVPPGLVYDFDYAADVELKEDPHARLSDLCRSAPPIFFTPRNGGHWVITSQSLLFEAARDPGLFSSAPAAPPGQPRPPTLLPLMVDPPTHSRYRAPLNAVFGFQAMKRLESEIRSLAQEHIDAVADKGGCEFVSAIAEPLPVSIFLKLMGLPQERRIEFRDAIRQLQDVKGARGIDVIAQIIEPFVQARRTDPKDDLISHLWSLDIDGYEITADEVRNYCILLYIAGLDTVINAMAFAARHLALDPALQRRLREEPSLIPAAIEEMLRRYGIVMPPRIVSRDETFGGVAFKRDDRVLLALPAGNLDQTAFAKPCEYDLNRETRGHLTFNVGPHHCVGALLARLEMRIIYEELLSRLPEFRLDPARPPEFRIGHIIAVNSLHLAW
jgi:cytochrome P450